MLINTEIYEYGTFLITLIFLIAAGISIRKKKSRRFWILSIMLLLVVICSIVFSTISSTLYVINEDFTCTKYHVWGNTTMKFDSRTIMKSKTIEYIIDPDPGKIMVLNRSMMDLYLDQEPFNPTFEKITVQAGALKKISIPGIDILPDNTTPDNTIFSGTKSIRYELSKW